MHSSLTSENCWGIIVILALVLGGCGHKGPLMLPAQTQVQSSGDHAFQDKNTNPQPADSSIPVLNSPQRAQQP